LPRLGALETRPPSRLRHRSPRLAGLPSPAMGKHDGGFSIEHLGSLSHIFNSSQPQRAEIVANLTKGSGRILGPQTYHLPPLEWITEPLRQGSSFISKSGKGIVNYRTVTSDVDFYHQPEVIEKLQPGYYGRHSLPWPRGHGHHDPSAPLVGDALCSVDKFYDTDVLDASRAPFTGTQAAIPPKQSFATEIELSTRKYAGVFASQKPRFKDANADCDLGPGQYEVATATIQIIDPKRASSAFKSVVKPSIAIPPSEAPDVMVVGNPVLERQAKAWRLPGQGVFSTRERFPRVRPRWNE